MLFFCLYVLECSLCVWSEVCSGEELLFGVDLHFSSEVNTTAAFESIFAFMRRESIFLVCMWCPSSLSGAQVITSRCRGTLSLQLSLWTSRAAGQAYEGWPALWPYLTSVWPAHTHCDRHVWRQHRSVCGVECYLSFSCSGRMLSR